MQDFDYRLVYLILWGKISSATGALRAALESGDTTALERAALRAYAELTGAQIETEEMLMSQ